MRIEEILAESQQLDELGLGDIGRKIGGAAQSTLGAVGAVAGGVRGAVDAAKHGFQVGRGTVGGAGAPVQAQQAAKWSANQAAQKTAAAGDTQAARLAQAAGDQTQDPNAGLSNSTQGNVQTTPPVDTPVASTTPPVAAPAQTKMNSKQVLAMINSLDPRTKTAVMRGLAPKPAVTAPVANAADATANLSAAAESTKRVGNVLEFHSKFLGRAI